MSLKRQASCLFHNLLTCLTLPQPARPQKPRRQFLAWALARRNRAIKPVALRHRKVRLIKIDELGASLGIVDDKADPKFAVPWDDSFIMGEEDRNPDSHKH